MKIQAINTNTSFKGLFTDKSKENGGNWKMEYQPYSWERNYSGEVGRMANKKDFSIYDSKLPDNEEVYFTNTRYRKESSKDIFGTESYYVNYDGTMRRTIDEKPAMNREKSLEVLYNKYKEFISQKIDEKKDLEVYLKHCKDDAESASEDYDYASGRQTDGYIYGQELFQKSEGLRRMYQAKDYMDSAKATIKQHLDTMFQKSQRYVQLTNSIIDVNNNKDNIIAEIKKLQELRASNKLIDLSVRSGKNPNAPLQEALQNMKTAADKFICLPHRLVSMSEVMKIVNPRSLKSSNSSEIVNCVETLIKKGI